MNEPAIGFLDGIEGELQQLANGLGVDIALGNIASHVRNSLQYAMRTSEINASADRVRRLVQEYAHKHGGPPISARDRDARAEDIERLRAAYLALRALLASAEPSAVSKALGY